VDAASAADGAASGRDVEKLLEGECGFVLHAGDDVLVGGHGEPGGGVPEPFGDDLDQHASLEEQGGVGVAEVVKTVSVAGLSGRRAS
jgi:hypothetical protein